MAEANSAASIQAHLSAIARHEKQSCGALEKAILGLRVIIDRDHASPMKTCTVYCKPSSGLGLPVHIIRAFVPSRRQTKIRSCRGTPVKNLKALPQLRLRHLSAHHDRYRRSLAPSRRHDPKKSSPELFRVGLRRRCFFDQYLPCPTCEFPSVSLFFNAAESEPEEPLVLIRLQHHLGWCLMLSR